VSYARWCIQHSANEVGLRVIELGERGRAVFGDEYRVAVGDQVVGEEGARRGVLLGEQDRMGGLDQPHSFRRGLRPRIPTAGRKGWMDARPPPSTGARGAARCQSRRAFA
jgi:hypothetical protein